MTLGGSPLAEENIVLSVEIPKLARLFAASVLPVVDDKVSRLSVAGLKVERK